MLSYLVRRVLLALFTCWAISVLAFIIIQLPPGDFVDAYISNLSASGSGISADQAEQLRAEYALDRFITEKWFWQGRLEYKRDRIEEVERQRTLGTGPGYQFWDNELGALSVATLVNRRDYRYSNGEQDRFYAMSVKWDYNRYLIGKTVELFSVGEVGRPLSGAADYSLDAEVGLRYKVTDWASLNMKAEKDMVSGAEGDLDETRYTLGFGVGW